MREALPEDAFAEVRRTLTIDDVEHGDLLRAAMEGDRE